MNSLRHGPEFVPSLLCELNRCSEHVVAVAELEFLRGYVASWEGAIREGIRRSQHFKRNLVRNRTYDIGASLKECAMDIEQLVVALKAEQVLCAPQSMLLGFHSKRLAKAAIENDRALPLNKGPE